MPGEPLQGRCPACGEESLVRGFQGQIVCSNTLCERRDAAQSVLTDPEQGNHLIRIHAVRRYDQHEGYETIHHWTLRHPLVERLNDDLFVCELSQYLDLMRQANQDLPEGNYRVTTLDVGGWSFDRVEPTHG